MSLLVTTSIIVLTLLSLMLSTVRISLQLLSPHTVRRMAEPSEGKIASAFAGYAEGRLRMQILLQIANQAAMVTVAVLITASVAKLATPFALPLALAIPWGVLVVFNHLLPRIVAHQSPERVARALLPSMTALASVLGPLGSLIAWLVVGRGSDTADRDDEDRRQELSALIDAGKESGAIRKEDATLVRSLVDFGDTILREVMTPRVDMVCIRADTPLHDLADAFVREGFARIPVYVDRQDNIEGFVHVKDVLAALRAGRTAASARELAKPVSFEPETKRVASTLRDMQAAKRQMAICIDEYGNVSGLVTVEDLLEEIVGEIHDEYDEVAPSLSHDEKGGMLVAGKTPLQSIRNELHVDLEEGSYETLSGLLLSLLGRIPQKGEHVDHAGYRFDIVEADRRRIQKVRITRLSKADQPAPSRSA